MSRYTLMPEIMLFNRLLFIPSGISIPYLIPTQICLVLHVNCP